MKAVFVAPNLNVGGLERQWSALVPGLAERGVETEVVTLDGRGQFFDDLTAMGVRTTYLDLKGRIPMRGVLRVVREIASRRADVVMSAGVSAHVVGQLASSRAGAKHVAAIHATSDWPLSRRRDLMLRVLAPRVTATTAVTSAQIEFIRSLGFDTSTTNVIASGVASPQLQRTRAALRADLALDEDAVVVLFVAALRPEKRVDLFLDAVTAAHARDSRIRGVIVGAGSEYGWARERCATTESVTALGHRTDVPELIHAADVVCLTSDTEALPLAVLEAMAGARPVVATDVGGVSDAVVHDVTGFLVPPGDAGAIARAVTTLAADPPLVARLGQGGRERYEAFFTLDRMVDAHLDLFRNLTSHSEVPSRLQ